MSDDTILFIADTHAGPERPGWSQQTCCRHLMPQIADGVGRLARERGAGLVVHGGDVTDLAELQYAADMFDRFGTDVAVCLGNHDLMTEGALKAWRALESDRVRFAPLVIPVGCADLVLANCAWHGEDGVAMFWDARPPAEAFAMEQAEWLDAALAAGDGARPTCVVIHAPLDPLPPRLTGEPDDIHLPVPLYVAAVSRVLDDHPRVRLVLSGHTHVNCATWHGRRVHVTTAAAIEVPFEVRLIRFGPKRIRIETLPAIATPEGVEYDETKAWVGGQPEDRTIEIPL